ncbi:MAG: hypothetical protein JWO15_3584 [Sphingomonadales bacterium]|nr:hypothetical protein [Sphingomonadales bacterium]
MEIKHKSFLETLEEIKEEFARDGIKISSERFEAATKDKEPPMSNAIITDEELAKIKKETVRKSRLKLKNLYKTNSIIMHNLKASKRTGLSQLRDQFGNKVLSAAQKLVVLGGIEGEQAELIKTKLEKADKERVQACSLHADIVSRRIDVLKREIRHIHLARAFYFGTPYKLVENKSASGFGVGPDAVTIARILKDHVTDILPRAYNKNHFNELVSTIQTWLKGEDKLVIRETEHGFDANGQYL